MSLYSWLHYTHFIAAKMYKAKSAKRKQGGKIWNNLSRVLSQESCRGYLIPPATNCDNMCKMLPVRATHLSLGVRVFTEGLKQRHIEPM